MCYILCFMMRRIEYIVVEKKIEKKSKKTFKKVLTKRVVRGIIVKRSRETAKNKELRGSE